MQLLPGLRPTTYNLASPLAPTAYHPIVTPIVNSGAVTSSLNPPSTVNEQNPVPSELGGGTGLYNQVNPSAYGVSNPNPPTFETESTYGVGVVPSGAAAASIIPPYTTAAPGAATAESLFSSIPIYVWIILAVGLFFAFGVRRVEAAA